MSLYVPLTRSFNATVRERATRDPAFRAALFGEAVQPPMSLRLRGVQQGKIIEAAKVR